MSNLTPTMRRRFGVEREARSGKTVALHGVVGHHTTLGAPQKCGDSISDLTTLIFKLARNASSVVAIAPWPEVTASPPQTVSPVSDFRSRSVVAPFLL